MGDNGLPDYAMAKEWERYQSVIGRQDWRWEPDKDQHHLPRKDQAGMLTASFGKETDPKGIIRVLQWLLENTPLIKPADDGGFTLSVRCNRRCDFTQQIGRGNSELPSPDDPQAKPVALHDLASYQYQSSRGGEIFVFVADQQHALALKNALLEKGVRTQRITDVKGKSRLSLSPDDRAKLEALGVTIAAPARGQAPGWKMGR
jgi:hypothetical protein